MRLFVLFAFISFSCLTHGADWTKWRGVNGNGMAQETDWNAQGINPASIKWRTDIGRGHSAMAVKGLSLYTMGEKIVINDSDTSAYDVVYCLDAATGNIKWTHEYPIIVGGFPGPNATPVLDENRVYTMSREGDIFCLNAQTGKVLWNRQVIKENLAQKPDWGFAGSALIVDDKVIFNAGKSGLALNKLNGTTIWKSAQEAGGLATPVLWKTGAEQTLLINANKTCFAVNAQNGDIIWSLPWFSYTDPLFDNDTFLMTAHDDKMALFHISDETPAPLWKNKLRAYNWNNFIIINGYAYGFNRNRRDFEFTCVDMKTGEAQWGKNLGWWGALTGSGDRIIVIDGEGELHILKANREKYDEIAHLTLWELGDWRQYPDNEPHVCWTMPILANGKIYVRTSYGHLACVDVSQ